MPFPHPSPNLQKTYACLLRDLLSRIEQLRGELGSILRCGPGCSACCRAFTVLPLEAARLQEAFAALGLERQNRIAEQARMQREICPFLLDDLCAVYETRPIICRTQGLAIGYIDEEMGNIEVSACPLNFPDDFTFVMDDLLLLDAYNARLFALNQEYCAAHGLPVGERIALGEIVRKLRENRETRP